MTSTTSCPPIAGYAEMALNDLPEDSPSRFDLQQVISAAGRAKDLVKQIRTFSRLHGSRRVSGFISFNPTCDLPPLIEKVREAGTRAEANEQTRAVVSTAMSFGRDDGVNEP
jgi:hypothetical protein